MLPLLADHGGRLLDRVRGERPPGYVEVHLLEFESPDGLDSDRADPRRMAAQHLLQEPGAAVEVIEASRT